MNFVNKKTAPYGNGLYIKFFVELYHLFIH